VAPIILLCFHGMGSMIALFVFIFDPVSVMRWRRWWRWWHKHNGTIGNSTMSKYVMAFIAGVVFFQIHEIRE
jgi:hypothetical protein